MSDIPRPSHADYTYQVKYGIRASSGGGRASARETVGRVLRTSHLFCPFLLYPPADQHCLRKVAAGAVAEKWLKEKYGTDIVAWVSGVHTVRASRELETDSRITRE